MNDRPPDAVPDTTPPGQSLAVAAEALFLGNLLVLPAVSFVIIAWLWMKHRDSAPALARCHLDQAFFVSLWGGMLLVVMIAIYAAVASLEHLGTEWTWVLVIVYFTCVHSTLVTLGIVGLARAMSGRLYVYPWIGPSGSKGGTGGYVD